jgi:CheY-like chemotaxis protein
MTRIILLVEDSSLQYKALASELEDQGWTVIRAQDREDACYQYDQALARGQQVNMVAVDLGLPPARDNLLLGGIGAIRDLRQRESTRGLPILAYTSLSPKESDYALVMKHLLALRCSFIYLRPMGDKEEFTDLVEYAWMGYNILSPVPADFLSSVVTLNPDPLDERLWETLQQLEMGVSQARIADAMSLTVEGVKARIGRIRELLVQAGEQPPDAETEDLIRWYREKRVQYSRP